MRKSKFLKHINQLGEEELREELTLLFDKLPEVKTFYKFELGDTKAKEKYYTRIKNDIKSKFATRSFKKPRRPRIQKINSMLSQLRKDVVFEFELISRVNSRITEHFLNTNQLIVFSHTVRA